MTVLFEQPQNITLMVGPRFSLRIYLLQTNQLPITAEFVSLISVKYWFTQISTLVTFNQHLTGTNRYILETNIIGKSS